MKLSFNLPSDYGYYHYLGCDDSQSLLSLIGIQDGSSAKTDSDYDSSNSALCDFYSMNNSNSIVYASLHGGELSDGPRNGLFFFVVYAVVSQVRSYFGFRSNLISLR